MANGRRATPVIALSTVAAFALGACAAEPSGAPADPAAPPPVSVADPIVTSYDGGLSIRDGKTLRVVKDIPLPGFLRLNPAGDDRHLLVSTATGFRVLDAVGATLTDVEFTGVKPGHVVRHAGRTVLFADGTGEVTTFDPKALGGAKPPTRTHRTPQPHHGVAIELANGELVTTVGNEEARSGIVALTAERKEIARDETCPGVHGEATAQGEAVVVGCESGALVYQHGKITKVPSPAAYGRIGNQAGSDRSPITLGDYKQDKDAELERPTRVSLIDTRTHTLKLVELGTSYTFRSLGRGPGGEGLVLGTDGGLRVLDPETGVVTKTVPVTGPWQEPLEWQQPRPALFVRGGTAYVTDTNRKEIHAVDLASGKKTATEKLPSVPNEVSGTVS
ncbi:zinc metallochaperone AztD [Amycolatopsis minnesotensis]|uniref:Zinc metallochaperone AztD n=1 Tax=Amycolatopsis minnesotensis TaxID=337894 RepID=A0ABN2R6K8_9PSEU